MLYDSVAVIGNGTSRKNININNIHIKKICCNLAFRDINCDALVCCDKRMVDTALNEKYSGPLYTRSDWKRRYGNKVNYLPLINIKAKNRCEQQWHWGSGTQALYLSGLLFGQVKNVHMIGFDLYSLNGLQNNIYSNEKHYKKSDQQATDPRYWIHQCAIVFKIYKDTQFTIWQNSDWKIPHTWNCDNINIKNLENIEKTIDHEC